MDLMLEKDVKAAYFDLYLLKKSREVLSINWLICSTAC